MPGGKEMAGGKGREGEWGGGVGGSHLQESAEQVPSCAAIGLE